MAASVTYRARLDLRRQTVVYLAALLHTERQRRGTRAGRRALGCFTQAVMVLRWFLDGTRLAQLAGDNTIGGSTAYRYVHEGIDILAARNHHCTRRSWRRKWPDTHTSTSTAR